MNNHVQVALVVAALLYLAWGISLLVAPEAAHAVLSTGPFNPTTTAMFGAALFAFVIVFTIAAHQPMRETMHASVAGLLFLGLVSAYQLFVAHTMPTSLATVVSLVLNLGIAFYLLIALTESAISLSAAGSARRAGRTGRSSRARLKTRRAARR